MKVNPAVQNHAINLILIAGAVYFAYRYTSGAAGRALQSVSDAVSELADNAKAAVNNAIDASYNPENAVSPTAGGKADVVDWSKVQQRNIDDLIIYFQRWGNTSATRDSAKKQGWTDSEISYAVAVMGANNGFY